LWGLLAAFGFTARAATPNPKSGSTEQTVTVQASTSPIYRSIAQTYHVQGFTDLEGLRFTLNASGPHRKIERHWEWWPGTGEVAYSGKDPNGQLLQDHYFRHRLLVGNAVLHQTIDRMFTSDTCWITFPFQLVWDKNLRFRSLGHKPLPIPPGKADCLEVTSTGGAYAPGDVFQLYYDPKDFLIKQWAVKRASQPDAVEAYSWSEPSNVGPVLMSLDYQGSGERRVWISDIFVKFKGSDWQSVEKLAIQLD